VGLAITPLDPSKDTHPDSVHKPAYYLYVSPSGAFEDSIFHRSMEAHFTDDRPWKQTELVRKVLWMVKEEQYAWHGCQTEADV